MIYHFLRNQHENKGSNICFIQSIADKKVPIFITLYMIFAF